jgi:hypothetical protein
MAVEKEYSQGALYAASYHDKIIKDNTAVTNRIGNYQKVTYQNQQEFV